MTTGSLSRDAGGLFESVRFLGKSLAESGVDVRAYGLYDSHWVEDAGEWEPLAAVAFPYLGPRAMAYAPAMDAALDAAGLDLVHLHGLWQYPSVATRRLWRRKGTPYVISPRGMLDSWALANSRWKKRVAAWVFENAVMRDAGCLHALCEAEAGAMRAYGLRQRIEVVPNGVGVPEMGKAESGNAEPVPVGAGWEDCSMQPEGRDERERTSQKLKRSGRRRLLFLGRIHPKKGLVGLLRAWAGLKRESARWGEWELVVAGWDQGGHEGELRGLCGELGLRVGNRMGSHGGTANTAGENLKLNSYKLKTPPPEAGAADVIFWGPAFGKEKEALLRSAEGFVLPSLSEGLPMSVLEAWAYGLPVVMTPECNLPEGFASQAALEIRNASTLHQATSHSPLATPTKLAPDWDGLRGFLEMGEGERRSMGMRGRRLVEERFAWPKVAARMREIYESLL